MKKKVFSIILAGALVLGLTACSGNTETETVGTAEATIASTQMEESQEDEAEEGKKTLIAYFSWSGNTEKLANMIQQETGSDLFEITPAEPYTEDYDALLEQAQQEQQDRVRPELAGKTIIPFCSHGGGRFGQSLTAIAKLAPEAEILEGLAVSYSGGSGLADDISAWLETNGIGRMRPFLMAANCFGDYYTRTGLNLAQREMITFCFLAAQGGCEPQLIAHAAGNMRLGNNRDFLIKVISQCLPYIGYPRSLNAISCINKACEKGE